MAQWHSIGHPAAHTKDIRCSAALPFNPIGGVGFSDLGSDTSESDYSCHTQCGHNPHSTKDFQTADLDPVSCSSLGLYVIRPFIAPFLISGDAF